MAYRTITIPQALEMDLERLAPATQVGVGSGNIAALRQWARPRWKVNIETPALDRKAAEELRGELDYHQGDIPFFWDGVDVTEIKNRHLIGVGDGTRTEFFLHHDRIVNGTVSVWVNGSPSSPTVTDETGLLTFSVAPGVDEAIEAIYKFTPLVLLSPESGRAYAMRRLSVERYQFTLMLVEFPNG